MLSIRKLIAIPVLLIILFSCTNLRQLTTYWESELQSDTIKPTGYDAITKVGWTSYNDSTHLYFAVDLLDPRVQMSVLRSGLTIYIDTTGKMKEDCSITYPVAILSQPGGRDAGNRSRSIQDRNNNPQEIPLRSMLANIEKLEMVWKQGQKTYRINPALGDTKFISALAVDSMNYLSLLIGVPMEMIHSQGIDGLNELTIGFGVPMSGGRGGGQPQASMSSGRGGRGGGGGGSRGGGGGGRGGAQMGGGSPQGGMAGIGPSLEKFWYKTVIRKNGNPVVN